MATLNYVKGDVTKPQGEGHKLIPHVCNDIGAWGAGVSGAIGRAFPAAEGIYRGKSQHVLGEVDFVKIDEGITIAHMVAQHGIRPTAIPNDPNERPPIRYGALVEAMEMARWFCRADDEAWCSIHAPMFGSALAGGRWDVIESLILELWVDEGIDVTIYQFED